GDVSVVGFDDMPEIGESLTTVRQDIAEVARVAVELLHEGLRGARVRGVRVAVRLGERGTTAERRSTAGEDRSTKGSRDLAEAVPVQIAGGAEGDKVRRAIVTALALALFAGAAWAQNVRIMGYGGNDPAIVVRLLDEVIGDELEAEGITVTYEPLEGDYNAALFNALSAGTAADVFYIPAETAPGIIATGKVLPLNGLVDTEPFIDSLIEAYTVDGQVYGIAKDFNSLALFYNK